MPYSGREQVSERSLLQWQPTIFLALLGERHLELLLKLIIGRKHHFATDNLQEKDILALEENNVRRKPHQIHAVAAVFEN
jgi:hypothetical protein